MPLREHAITRISCAGVGGITIDAQVWTNSADLIIRTPRYMAPEQAADDPAADNRTGLNSLGVLAFEVLVGAVVQLHDNARTAASTPAGSAGPS
jgi:hypothetical protein